MNNKLRDAAADAACIAAGPLLIAAALVIFTIPNDIAPGGLSGMATTLAHITPVSVGLWTLILNLPLIAAAVIGLGIKPLFKTLISTLLLCAEIELLSYLLPAYRGDPIAAAVFGGALSGAGVGVLFLRGISSGGTDLLSLIVAKRLPNISLGKLMLLIDAAVVVFASLIFKDANVAIYSAISIYVSSKAIDAIIRGFEHAKVIYVVTSQGEMLTELLNERSERGSTTTEAVGGYTGEQRQVITTVVKRNALAQTLALIKTADPAAFVFVVNAAEVHGEGFKVP